MIDVGCQETFTCDECPYWYECCDGVSASEPIKQKSGKKKTGRAYRRRMRAKKLGRMMDIISNRHAIWMYAKMDRTGLPASNSWGLWTLGIDSDDVPKAYVRKPRPSKYRKFYKNYSNRVIRRSDVILPKGNQHRKLFDYWWTID